MQMNCPVNVVIYHIIREPKVSQDAKKKVAYSHGMFQVVID